jgi:geranylgeranyl diphosphate synthase type II
VLGKPTGSDSEQNKTTFLSFYSVEQAKEYAAHLTEKAISEISEIDGSQRLTDFACYLLDRQK